MVHSFIDQRDTGSMIKFCLQKKADLQRVVSKLHNKTKELEDQEGLGSALEAYLEQKRAEKGNWKP
jgi:DNA mismatch repair ATPase MutS